MRLRYAIAVLAYCGLVFWLSSMSDPPGADLDMDGSDKVAHFIVFGIMAVLVSLGLHDYPKGHPRWLLVAGPVLFAVIYGVSDEIHQRFTPGRSFSYMDMVADALGALAGQWACLYYVRRQAERRSSAAQGTS